MSTSSPCLPPVHVIVVLLHQSIEQQCWHRLEYQR
jgi:hypothetical protein